MKFLKIAYYFLLAFLAVMALLLILSVFPIPGNFKILTVLSGSMEPTIKTGAVVVIKPANDYNIGDIITFGPNTRTQVPITHRIYDIKIINGSPVYITMGDANNAPDGREIPKKEVIGKALFSVPYSGYLIAFIKKPIGFVLLLIVPVVIVLADETKNIIKELKNKKTADENNT